MNPQNKRNFFVLENSLSYTFKDPQILQQALTHPSMKIGRKVADYERLEFLGDSIIGFVVSDIIYKNYSTEDEGKLAKRKAAIVSRDSLAAIARKLKINESMILSHGEEALGGRNNPANLENVIEALAAALYLDGGIEVARKFIEVNFAETINKMITPPKDPKSALQEWAQSKGLNLPLYDMVEMSGPSHLPQITIKLTVGEHEPVIAKAGSKKDAERIAAEKMLEVINGK
jgi:ribonuclease-3